jgi:hypothetical protein
MARPHHALDKIPLQTFEPLSTTCLLALEQQLSQRKMRSWEKNAKNAKAESLQDITVALGFDSPLVDRESLRVTYKRASPSADCCGTFSATAHSTKMAFDRRLAIQSRQRII